MGNAGSGVKNKDVFFTAEDINNNLIKNVNRDIILINTLPIGEQNCLIPNTISCDEETKIINAMLNENNMSSKKIVVYGRNWSDPTVRTKHKQLTSLGFKIVVYVGGIFEWVCLQEIFGDDVYPTTSTDVDPIRYMP